MKSNDNYIFYITYAIAFLLPHSLERVSTASSLWKVIMQENHILNSILEHCVNRLSTANTSFNLIELQVGAV